MGDWTEDRAWCSDCRRELTPVRPGKFNPCENHTCPSWRQWQLSSLNNAINLIDGPLQSQLRRIQRNLEEIFNQQQAEVAQPHEPSNESDSRALPFTGDIEQRLRTHTCFAALDNDTCACCEDGLTQEAANRIADLRKALAYLKDGVDLHGRQYDASDLRYLAEAFLGNPE